MFQLPGFYCKNSYVFCLLPNLFRAVPQSYLRDCLQGLSPQKFCQIKHISRASLVAQWLRICLPMQGTRVRALVREDPTCRRATKPVRHNYRARMPQLLKPARLEPMLLNKRSHRNEKPVRSSEDPTHPKIK